jgi:hypothetical protein
MCTCAQYGLSHYLTPKCFYRFAIIIRVALQGYSEHTLPNFVSRATQRYNRYLSHSIWSPVAKIQKQINLVLKDKAGVLLYVANLLTPELNPTAQRCMTRFFTWDFAS